VLLAAIGSTGVLASVFGCSRVHAPSAIDIVALISQGNE